MYSGYLAIVNGMGTPKNSESFNLNTLVNQYMSIFQQIVCLFYVFPFLSFINVKYVNLPTLHYLPDHRVHDRIMVARHHHLVWVGQGTQPVVEVLNLPQSACVGKVSAMNRNISYKYIGYWVFFLFILKTFQVYKLGGTSSSLCLP